MHRAGAVGEMSLVEKTTRLSPFVQVRECGQIHNFAKSAVRALDILELLAATQQPMRAIEIARALSLSPSSADQILKTMLDSGYLALDAASKRYHLPARLMRLGVALSTTYFDPQSIENLMRDVQQECGGRVMLAAAQGLFMQLIDVRERQDAVPVSPDQLPAMKGLHTPFFGTTTGAAWMSAQSEDTIRRLVQKCRRELGPRADDVDGVLESIRRVRKQGYAFGGLMVDDGWWSVAVPLPPAANGLVLVLVVVNAAPVIETNAAGIAAAMKRCIELHLGATVSRS
jgi:DNA-binding IclR family transcriptional regulator